MIKVAASLLAAVALASLAAPVVGEDDFPLVGTYTENQVCKGDASDAGVSRVKITSQDGRTFLNVDRPILDPMATVIVVEFEGDRVQR